MSEVRALPEPEIAAALTELPDWRLEAGKLKATFTFGDFKAAFAFMTAVAAEAERMEHHPEWTNVYNRVEVILSTHDAGDVVTALDTALAAFMSQAARGQDRLREPVGVL